MFSRATGYRCIARRKKSKMIEVGARQAQRAPVPLQSNPGFPAQLFATLITLRLPIRDKDFDFLTLHHGIWMIRLTEMKAKPIQGRLPARKRS
jgi:hypothetical protein